MRTPSLRRRLALVGLVSFAALLGAVNVTLYHYLERELEATIEAVLRARADVAEALGQGRTPQELHAALEGAGIPAVIRGPDDTELQTSPLTVRAGKSPPVSPGLPLAPRISRTVTFEDGTSIEVFATLAGVHATLRDLVIGEVAISLLALAMGGLVLRRVARFAFEPLDTVVATVDRITHGELQERLRPDRPTTEIGRLAQAFDEMLDGLEAAVTDAREAEETSRRFLADAAHQLRTPVAALQASLEALLHESDRDRRDRIVDNGLRETRRLGQLLRSLLMVARLDQGEVTTEEQVDVLALVRQETDRMQTLVPELNIETVGPPGAPGTTVPGDAATLQEAVANLLDNARRHAATTVAVSVTVTETSVHVSVHDDGPGLREDQVERAFQRFSSLDGEGGSGLGLPIARAVAMAHGGDLGWSDGAFELMLPRGGATVGTP